MERASGDEFFGTNIRMGRAGRIRVVSFVEVPWYDAQKAALVPLSWYNTNQVQTSRWYKRQTRHRHCLDVYLKRVLRADK